MYYCTCTFWYLLRKEIKNCVSNNSIPIISSATKQYLIKIKQLL